MRPDTGGATLRAMRRAAVGVMVIVAALSTGRAAAVPPERAIPVENPDLVASCGLDIHMILDESGSVGIHAGVVRRAFNAFTSALNNTGSRIAVSEFSTVADLPLSGAARNTYTTVPDQTRADTFGPYIATGYRPDGATNWEDGMRMGRYFLPRPSAEQPHLTVFITDGDPNEVIKGTVSAADYQTTVPLGPLQVQELYDSNRAKDAAVANANAVKAQGSHILAIAVGAGLSSQASLDRIEAVSGDDVYSGFGTFDITTDDVYRVADFGDLEEALREAAFGLCATVDHRAQVRRCHARARHERPLSRSGRGHDDVRQSRPCGLGAARERRGRKRDGDHRRERVRVVPVDDGDARRLG